MVSVLAEQSSIRPVVEAVSVPSVTGWACALSSLLRFHEKPADPAQIAHALGTDAPSSTEAVRYLRSNGLRARMVSMTVENLPQARLPAIAVCQGGEGCLLLASAKPERVLVVDDASGRPTILPMAEFAARWNGQLILATRRGSLSDLGRRFDIGWFLGAIHKYRSILTEAVSYTHLDVYKRQ